MANSNVPYVKFQRGTPEAFAKLTSPSADTLYFVSNKNATDGKLYLGKKLIAGSTIGDLIDTEITGDIEDNLILSYNAETEKWEAKNATNVLKDSTLIRVMKPATATEDGLSGYVPQPTAGKEHRYLSSTGGWEIVAASLTDEDREDIVAEVKEIVEEMTWGNF